MRTQTIGFSTSILLHGAFGLLLFSLATLAPEVTPPVVIDLSLLAGPATAPAPQAVPAPEPKPEAIVPAAQPVVQEVPPPVELKEVVQPPPRKKIVKKPVVPKPETVQIPAPAMATAVEQEVTPPVSEAPEMKVAETESPASQPALARREEGGVPDISKWMPAAGQSNGSDKTLTVEERWRQEHFNFIKETIRKNMIYPVLARKNGWQGRVLVSFVICLDGRVEDIRITESSGIALLDKHAVDIIKQSAPFPNPPVRATLIVPIDYNLG